MITEIKERKVMVSKEPSIYYFATVRDGQIADMTPLHKEGYIHSLDTDESIQLYITFLMEILEAMRLTIPITRMEREGEAI